MFKPIGGVLDKKKNSLLKAEEKTSDIERVFNKFLNKYFSGYKGLFEWEASYNPKDGKVVINTSSKVVAGELSLKIKELGQILREDNLKVTQIVIL